MGMVADWLDELPIAQSTLLRPYFERAQALVPEAEEGIAYAMPALKYRGRGLVALMPTKAGYSIYPFSGVVVGGLMARHPDLEHTKGSIHFTAASPLASDIFEELVLAAKADADRRLDRSR